MAQLGKRLKKAYEGIDPTTLYDIKEAVKLVKTRAKTKFDETAEIAMNLNVDPRNADQNLRGTVMLPNGTGKTLRVAEFAPGARPQQGELAAEEEGGHGPQNKEVRVTRTHGSGRKAGALEPRGLRRAVAVPSGAAGGGTGKGTGGGGKDDRPFQSCPRLWVPRGSVPPV